MRKFIIFTCLFIGCGFAGEDTVIEEENIIHPPDVNINEFDRTKLVECTFKVNMKVYLPDEYSHYFKVKHFFSLYWDNFVRGEVVTITNLSLDVPCSACVGKIYGGLEVLDSQYGKKYWGCGDTQPPLYPTIVVAKMDGREHSFTPDLASKSDVCNGRQILVDLSPVCDVMYNF